MYLTLDSQKNKFQKKKKKKKKKTTKIGKRFNY